MASNKTFQRKAKTMTHETATNQSLEPVFPVGHRFSERIFYDSREGKYYDAGTDLYLEVYDPKQEDGLVEVRPNTVPDYVADWKKKQPQSSLSLSGIAKAAADREYVNNLMGIDQMSTRWEVRYEEHDDIHSVELKASNMQDAFDKARSLLENAGKNVINDIRMVSAQPIADDSADIFSRFS